MSAMTGMGAVIPLRPPTAHALATLAVVNQERQQAGWALLTFGTGLKGRVARVAAVRRISVVVACMGPAEFACYRRAVRGGATHARAIAAVQRLPLLRALGRPSGVQAERVRSAVMYALRGTADLLREEGAGRWCDGHLAVGVDIGCDLYQVPEVWQDHAMRVALRWVAAAAGYCPLDECDPVVRRAVSSVSMAERARQIEVLECAFSRLGEVAGV